MILVLPGITTGASSPVGCVPPFLHCVDYQSLSPQKFLECHYISLFHSHLSYGVLSWGHSAIVKRVFGIQRRAIRVLARLDYREDCRDSFRNLKILTLPSLYIYECLRYVTANIDLMQRHNGVHDYATRNNNNLRQPQLRLSRSRNSTNFYGIKFYNIIGKDLISLPRIRFLSSIKEYLLKKAFFGVDEFMTDPPTHEWVVSFLYIYIF